MKSMVEQSKADGYKIRSWSFANYYRFTQEIKSNYSDTISATTTLPTSTTNNKYLFAYTGVCVMIPKPSILGWNPFTTRVTQKATSMFPMSIALRYNKIEVVHWLLQQGVKLDDRALIDAVRGAAGEARTMDSKSRAFQSVTLVMRTRAEDELWTVMMNRSGYRLGGRRMPNDIYLWNCLQYHRFSFVCGSIRPKVTSPTTQTVAVPMTPLNRFYHDGLFDRHLIPLIFQFVGWAPSTPAICAVGEETAKKLPGLLDMVEEVAVPLASSHQPPKK
jgi:hypothetical protein